MHEVFETLGKIRASGTTILIVEQNVRLALRYVDRGYLLANGSIRFEGSAEELAQDKVMHGAYLA
ncbi:MAG: branched-chain amino acid ABC transporter ATP-binding protein, partial [Patescibacteria group bacterium]